METRNDDRVARHYLADAEEGLVPLAPSALTEQHDDGPVLDRVYTKAELEAYLRQCQQKCQATIMALTDEDAQRLCRFGWGEVTFVELLLYTMRHVQEHAAQLGLLLGQKTPGWVAPPRASAARPGPATQAGPTRGL